MAEEKGGNSTSHCIWEIYHSFWICHN